MILTKLIYILFFAACSYVIYSRLNNPGKISNKLFWLFTGIFWAVAIIHTGLFNWGFLMGKRSFFMLVLMLFIPAAAYFCFNYIVIKNTARLKAKGVDEKLVDASNKGFSFFFLRFFPTMVLITQCMVIFTTEHFAR